jgi:peptide/nickel transport system permease protein
MGTGGIVIGVTLGLVSGYFRRKIDAVIMRVGELFSSFPDIFLMILIAATLRPRILEWVRWLEDNTVVDGIVKSGIVDYFAISIALVSFSWIGMARLVRGQVLALMQTQFVESAQAVGASTPRILFVHLLPNAISPVVVTVSMGMGALVGTEIILSFLGLGIQPPRPSLGTMLLEAGSLSALREVPWMLLAPGLVAWTLVLTWNLLGDALNDVLNPRTR